MHKSLYLKNDKEKSYFKKWDHSVKGVMVRIMSRMWEYKGGTLKTIRCYQCEHSVNTNDNDDDDDDGNVVT